MTAFAYEGSEGRSAQFATNADGSSLRVTYYVKNADTEDDAITAVLGVADGTIDLQGQTLFLQGVDPELIDGDKAWKCVVRYGDESQSASQEGASGGTGSWKFTFDTTGGTAKISNSLQTIARYERSLSNPAPDLLGVIGWDGKEIHGVEMIVPQFEFDITAYYAPATVTTSWCAGLARATGKVNNDSWLGFAAGEVLYAGAQGSGTIPVGGGTATKPVEVKHRFLCSENRTNIAVGDMTITSKKGWHYLWVKYEKVEDSGSIIPIPVHAYVERIYPETSFVTFFGFS